MAKQVQLRRGSASDHTTFTGAVGELTYVSDDKTLRIHDGSTARGVPVGSGILSARSRGAVGDGATDDTVALQAVIDAATGAVDLEGLTYLITATLTLKSGLILQNGTITYPTMTDDVALSATGTEGSDLSVTGNIAFDATTLELSSGDAATLSKHDMIFITDDQAWNASKAAGTYTQGEIARVNGVSGTTITLENPTAGQYTTAKSAVVRKLSQYRTLD